MMTEPREGEPTVHVHGGRRRPELTVREYAIEEGVTERTVWNWIAKDAVKVRRTPGGGIRILKSTEG